MTTEDIKIGLLVKYLGAIDRYRYMIGTIKSIDEHMFYVVFDNAQTHQWWHEYINVFEKYIPNDMN